MALDPESYCQRAGQKPVTFVVKSWYTFDIHGFLTVKFFSAHSSNGTDNVEPLLIAGKLKDWSLKGGFWSDGKHIHLLLKHPLKKVQSKI